MDMAGKMVTAAGIAYVGTPMILAGTSIVVPGVGEVSMPLFMATVAAGSSLLSDYAQSQIFPMWSAELTTERRVNAAVASGVAAAGVGVGLTVPFMRTPGSRPPLFDLGASRAMALGVGSELAGSYMWYNVLKPALAPGTGFL